MDADLLRAKKAEAANIRRACLPGFSLRIGQRATLLRSACDCVYGLVMQLTHEEIEQLYSEPSVQAYRPEAVLTQLDDGSYLPALCFNLVISPARGESNPEYAAKLRALAFRLQLPAEYVERIR